MTTQLSLGMRRLIGGITVVIGFLIVLGYLHGGDLMTFLLAVFA